MCWVSEKENVCNHPTQPGIWDLRNSRCIPHFYAACCIGRLPFPKALDIWLIYQGGSYKGPQQVFRHRKCFFSRFSFQAPWIHQDQQSRHKTGWWSVATLWTHLQSRAGGVRDFKGLYWDKSGQRIHQTLEIPRRYSQPIWPEVRRFSPVMCRLLRPQ